MSLRAATGALLAVSLLALGPGDAFAQDPKPSAPPAAATAAPSAPPAPASAPAPAAPAPQAQAHGVIVVAIGDPAGRAARALAMEVYRDAALRPPIDETTARVLAGDAPGETAAPRLKEIAELRASVARTESDLVMRRLLASIGADLGAPLVVWVTLDAGRPVARALRSNGAALERVELGATIETAPDGAKTYRWPGATITLRGILGVAEPLPAPTPPAPDALRPIAQKSTPPPAPSESRPFYKSPWFWGTAGAVVAAGVTVLVLSRTSAAPGEAHLTGKVGP